jgi:hypothetical protein
MMLSIPLVWPLTGIGAMLLIVAGLWQLVRGPNGNGPG